MSSQITTGKLRKSVKRYGLMLCDPKWRTDRAHHRATLEYYRAVEAEFGARALRAEIERQIPDWRA